MSTGDGVDARARRVAARLLSPRSRRTSPGRPARRPGPDATGASPARHAGAHPAGAARLTKTLRALEADGWVTLTQPRRPGADGESGPLIDHVVIGPGGIVVIDSRAWVGRIEVTRGVVQQNGFWRERQTAAVARTAGSIAALLLPQHRTAVHAVICVTQHDLPEQVVAPGVHVVGVSGLGRTLRALPYRLHPAEVLHLNTVLRRTLVDAPPPPQLTTEELDDRRSPYGRTADDLDPARSLFVPVETGLLRAAARGTRRRTTQRRATQRRAVGPPWWRTPGIVIPRALLVLALAAFALLVGPALLRPVLHAVEGAPASSVEPAGTGLVRAPSVVVRSSLSPSAVPTAMTASDEPQQTLAPQWSQPQEMLPSQESPNGRDVSTNG